MAFAERIIDLTFTKAAGLFAQSQTNIIHLSGLRVQCSINNFSGVTTCEAQLRILGMTQAHLIDLAAPNSAFMAQRNIKLEIRAGVAGAMDLIFSGAIATGQIDLNNQPDSALVIIAQSGLLDNVIPAGSTSYPKTTDHISILSYLASKMGLAFIATGTPKILNTPYIYGSYRDQVIRVVDAASVNFMIMNDTLYVWPRYGLVDSAAIRAQAPLISPDTGMVGYPTFSDIGVSVTTLFNSALRPSQTVTIASSMQFANGSWNIYHASHELESQTPNGKWFTHFDAQPFYE